MNLRYYQRDCIAALYDYFEKYTGNPIAALPTGTGKSYIIAWFLYQLFCKWPGQRVMMITHVKELIGQNFKELVELWPTAPAGIYSDGLGRKEVRPITFAGIKSIVRKAALFGHIDIILIDECHIVGPDSDTEYRSFISDLKAINPKLKIIGLTATPYRLGQGLLTESTEKNGKVLPPLFTDICYDITGLEAFNRLIQEGFLCTLNPKKTNTKLDVSTVTVRGGEFVQGELQRAVDKQEVTYAALSEAIELGWDRKHWLVFGTGRKHCEHIVSILESMGISCACVHSETPDKLRDDHVEAFKAGKVKALVNNAIFIAGFNFKPIDLIIDLQPTSSASRHVQKYGRGTRPSPETGKADCLILDFAGNTRRIGPINDPKIPKPKNRRIGDEDRLAPVKCCPFCLTYNHSSARVCTSCKAEFPPSYVNLDATASTENIIVGAGPDIQIFKVNKVIYDRYKPSWQYTKPPILKASYTCGLRQFDDMVCLEHEGYPSKKARDWWRTMSEDLETEPPKDLAEALSRLNQLRRPTHIKVWINCKYPKLMGYDFDGTAFGTEKPSTF